VASNVLVVTGITGTRFGLSPRLNCWYRSCTVAEKLGRSGGCDWRQSERFPSVARKLRLVSQQVLFGLDTRCIGSIRMRTLEIRQGVI